ncbi:SDR family NAD(P)-dependent oxidoreductase [Immundisolibacter sp.]|uniref:SDR family NAD(P)-dependent oxidoreductase n=1 Tax=Immundisolibacter sp. TaxID=1934948 RepID=UPI002B08FFA5|nr:SDR family NAD(P)-dependent oxidoreductase [Immundisolibacter sp.]MEA3220453.1 2,5-dichloro-2,5-cyclohexadiene-1,4-diol dehydrogenase [Immundisolibacter sp.]
MARFDGKSVIVTGGGSGIGAATARAFAAQGAAVMIGDINAKAGEAVAADIRASGQTAAFTAVDTTKKASVEALVAAAVAAHGKLDVVFANAGVFDGFLPFTDIDEALFDRVIGVNVKGYFFTCQAAFKELKKTGGNIVMTASVAGLGAGGGGAAYTASKYATIGLINQIGVEAAAHGVRVNGVAPGGVKTGMTEHLIADPAVAGFITQGTPLGRWAEPDEIAAAVVFLASDEARYITGTVLRVDGGMRSK